MNRDYKVTFNGMYFRAMIEKSVDHPEGHYRLMAYQLGEELGDGYESQEEAVEALYLMYPGMVEPF